VIKKGTEWVGRVQRHEDGVCCSAAVKKKVNTTKEKLCLENLPLKFLCPGLMKCEKASTEGLETE